MNETGVKTGEQSGGTLVSDRSRVGLGSGKFYICL